MMEYLIYLFIIFFVEGTKLKKCDFEEGFCDLIQISDPLLSRWMRTISAPGLEHDHRGNTSGMTLNSPFCIQTTSCIYISSLLFSFLFRIFLIACTFWRKQNHCRPNQSCFPAQSRLPGDKNSFVGVCKHSLTDFLMVFCLLFFCSTVEFPALCWSKAWTSSGLCPEYHTG